MASDPEALQPDVLAEEEPKYLRRQKPVEIRRRKFGRRGWQLFKRIVVGGAAALAGGYVVYQAVHFFLYSPRVALARPQQIEVTGNHFVPRAAVIEKFMADRGLSVLRVPLDKRRKALEGIPWVESAGVERILPNRIRVNLVERAPVAFLRLGADLALVDAHGVILERPADGDFHFPVVAGIADPMPREAREQRVRLFVEFMKDIELIRPGAGDTVSEVDLSDAKDVRATLTGTSGAAAGAPADLRALLVHFGDGDFANKYRLFIQNMAQWRASAGRVDSVDLRFARQAVVNPESKTTTVKGSARPEAAGKRR